MITGRLRLRRRGIAGPSIRYLSTSSRLAEKGAGSAPRTMTSSCIGFHDNISGPCRSGPTTRLDQAIAAPLCGPPQSLLSKSLFGVGHGRGPQLVCLSLTLPTLLVVSQFELGRRAGAIVWRKSGRLSSPPLQPTQLLEHPGNWRTTSRCICRCHASRGGPAPRLVVVRFRPSSTPTPAPRAAQVLGMAQGHDQLLRLRACRTILSRPKRAMSGVSRPEIKVSGLAAGPTRARLPRSAEQAWPPPCHEDRHSRFLTIRTGRF